MTAAALIASARQKIAAKDLTGAVGLLVQATAKPDCAPEEKIEAGALFAAAGDKAKAVAAYLEAGTSLLYDAGDVAAARAAFAQAHQTDPSDLDVLFQMGQTDVVEGRTQDALAKFIDVLRKSNLKHIPALFEAGCVYQANGQYDQAILAFKKVLDRDKAHVQAIVHMGQLHQTKGMVPEALGHYMQAAEIARESKQFGTAQQLCTMVLALDGANQKARFMLDDLAERGQDEAAAAAAMNVAKPAPRPVAAPPQTEARAQPQMEARAQPQPAIEELAAQRAALTREIEELAVARLEAEHALARIKDESEAAAADAETARTRMAREQAELNSLKESLAQMRALAEEAALRKNQLEAEAKSAAAALAAAIAASDAAKQAQAATSASAEKRRAELEMELADLAARCADAETQARSLAETERRAAAAAARLAATESSIGELEARKKEVEEACAKSASLATAAEEKRVEAVRAAEQAEALRAKAESQIKTAQRDFEKTASASQSLAEIEDRAAAAAARLAATESSIGELEARKKDADEAYARSKSLAAAAEEKRLEAARAAEQAEALRAKREADADALAARIGALEAAAKEASQKAELAAAEETALAEATAKVVAARQALHDIERTKAELEEQRREADRQLASVRQEIDAANVALQRARADAATVLEEAARGVPEPRRRMSDESYAETPVAVVPAQACAEALRTIESLAADGEIPFEIAAELAGLIHEGRAVEALRVARARANLASQPAAFTLAVGDLARDLGDAAGAREAYRQLAAADPSRTAVVHQRLGELFLTFADKGTAAALARDDAHYASAQEPGRALEAYAELVARFPDDASFRQELGEAHERLGNVDAAALAYSQALAQYLASDDAAKAVELVPRLLAARPESGAALELAARAYERAGMTAEANKSLDEALRAYRHAKAAGDVERVCRRLAETSEDPVPYRQELAVLLKGVGDLGGAAEQLLEAAERLLKWSNPADALALLREALALAGDVEPLRDRIRAAKERAVEAQGSVDAASRAAMLLTKKQFEKAAEAFRAAVDKNPYDANACYQLACLLTDHFPDYDTAEQLLENAAELRPGHTATRYRLALVKAARGEVEHAVELLVALARFDENNAEFIDQFVERLEKDAEAGSVAAKYRLGVAYRELGRVEEALVILQSIQREPEFIVLCLNGIGLCLRRQGLDTAAAKRFQKAIETAGYPETQYNEALYNLGDLYEAKRDPESLAFALSSFEELYARDCTFRDVGDRIKSVKHKLGAAETPKVKRLPNRAEAVGDR